MKIMEGTRFCQSCHLPFEVTSQDFAFYEKIKVPAPTFCSLCRKQRRLAWRNDMNLYSRTCDLCGKNMISIYSPESGLTVYCVKCWWSDAWDPKTYAKDYDFSQNFFRQFRELQTKVPRIGLMNDNGLIGGSVNCEYNQDFARAKNCYMVFVAWKIEDCMYSYYLVGGKSIVDSLYILNENDSVYENIFTANCYKVRNAYYSSDLTDSAFCYDCRNSQYCFMCVGVRNKKYCFKNQQYSQSEYEKVLSEFRLNTYTGTERARMEFQEFLSKNTTPRRYANMRNTVNSTGDCLTHCKNAKDCFFLRAGEDCRFVEGADTVKDTYDLSTGGELSLAYEGITPDHTYLGRFGIFSWKNTDYFYLDGCHSSENLFGCVGLKKAQYCILNKQYTKIEYQVMVLKIIDQMNSMPYTDKLGIQYKFGEFYPAELSYFGYNESMAQDHFPLSREEALQKGLPWQERLQFTKNRETLKVGEIPDAIEAVSDSILNAVLACAECGRNYRIIRQELDFYRRLGIPIPRRCFYCRHKARMQFKNPSKLWPRQCQCASAAHFHGNAPCSNIFETAYAPDRPEIVYCESCYLSEVA